MELLKLNKNIDEEMTEAANLFSFEDVKDLLPKRKLDSHKGMFGKIAILAGDAGYEGAGILASAGALSVGAGLVRLLSQENAVTPALSYLPELMVSGSDNPQDFKDDIKSAEVIVCGPGFKDSYWSEQLLYMAIESAKENNQTLIMDAGALRLLCNKPFQDTDLPSKLILTPHPGEAAALLNLSTEEIQENRLSASTNLATKFKASIVLKGHQTVISSNANYICNEGSPALSIPGSGDILAGIIAGLIGNKLDSLSAIKLGVAVHGRSGTEYSKNFGDRGLDAKTLIELIKRTLISFPMNILLEDESASIELGRLLSDALRSADEEKFEIHLEGNLGAGKTTIARSLINVLAGRVKLKVQPTQFMKNTKSKIFFVNILTYTELIIRKM